MSQDIIPADKRLRKQMLLLVVMAVVAMSLYFGFLFGEIEKLNSSDQPDVAGLQQQLRWMSLAFVGACAAMAVYLLNSGLRAVVGGRFPAVGARVMRDTVVKHGAAARAIGLLLALLGVLLVVAAMTVHWWIARFLELPLLP